MNQLLLHLASASLAAAAFLPTAGQAAPVLPVDRHADSRVVSAGSAAGRVGAAIQPCLASETAIRHPDRTGADETLVWALLTGGAALLAFARRSSAVHGRTGARRQ